MDGRSHKIYHQPEFNSKDFYDHNLSPGTHTTRGEEVVFFPMEQLYKEMSAGYIGGKTLIEFTPGPVLYKLLVCCEFFKEIYVLEFNKECCQELQKWLRKEPGALDWSHVSQYACALEGKSDWKEKVKKVREQVKQVIDCDVTADPVVAPGTLPPADCVVCVYGLDLISKDQDDFRKNLRKMVAMLKVGGYLGLFGAINAKFYKVGEHVFHMLNYDEEFLRTAIKDAGFVIESLEKRPKADVGGYVIYDGFFYVRARKVRKV